MKNDKKTESRALRCAKACLALMIERNIDPTPVNYSVWYHYLAGDMKELKEEIDTFLKTKTAHLTDDVNLYFYNKYITPPDTSDEEAVNAASQNAQTVLGEVMGIIEKFSGDTTTYNHQIDTHVSSLSNKITDPALKDMAREIITRALAIRDSGTELSSKLDESKQEVAQLRETLEKVTLEANKDGLTGVGNRKALDRKLDELSGWAKETNSDLCLLMIDIDHFKRFNDKFGHQLGDEVLKKVASSLFESIKGKDFVGRYGGEEFAILLPNTPLSGALVVAENIRKSIEATQMKRRDTGDFVDDVTISVGVSRFRTDKDSPALFMARADDALYRSKKGGRNRVTQESFE